MILNFDASNIKPEDDKISHDEELDNRIRELTKGKFVRNFYGLYIFEFQTMLMKPLPMVKVHMVGSLVSIN